MNALKIGLIREGKIPPDKRVAFTPLQAEEIEQRFPHVKVVCQTSPIRCFRGDEYAAHDITVTDDVGDCDILMGIKEVPIDSLISGKTYLFFSHTLKNNLTTGSYCRLPSRRTFGSSTTRH